MKVGGQLQASGALPLGKLAPLPTGYEATWTPALVWCHGEEKNLFSPAGNRTMILRSFFLYSTYHTDWAIPLPIEIDETVLNYCLDKWFLNDNRTCCQQSVPTQHRRTWRPSDAAHFTGLFFLALFYVKINFCRSFFHIATINLAVI